MRGRLEQHTGHTKVRLHGYIQMLKSLSFIVVRFLVIARGIIMCLMNALVCVASYVA